MERPWLAHYDPDVPASLAPYPETTLVEAVARHARTVPERVALVFEGARVRYGELDRLSDAFAVALSRLGVRRGHRVALVLPNCPQFVIAELGAWKLGATVVPLNPLYNEEELVPPLASTGAQTVVVLTPFYERLRRVRARAGLKELIATNVKEFLPPLTRIAFGLLRERKGGHRIRLDPADHSFPALVAEGGRPDPAAAAGPGDLAFILLSGGTTGTPKGVACPHRGLVASALQTRAWLGKGFREAEDRMLLPLPLFHAAGGVLGQCTFLHAGGTLVLAPDPRDVSGLLRSIRRDRPAFFAGVPALLSAILRHPQAGRRGAFGSVRYSFSGAAPLHAETKRRFEAVTGCRVVEAYSLTEALVAPIGTPLRGKAKPGAVGLPGPDVDLRIVDAETGARDLPPGEVGEILIQAPQVMPGYWNAPAETALALRDHGPRGRWLHSGDLGYLDQEGYLFIVDRKKDLMKPGGLQVWPREVEEVILTHPAVAEVGVAAVPDIEKGEAVKAWVVLRDRQTVSPQELRMYCKTRLAPYKVPSQIELRAELPKSLVGKVLRRALVAEHLAARAAG